MFNIEVCYLRFKYLNKYLIAKEIEQFTRTKLFKMFTLLKEILIRTLSNI